MRKILLIIAFSAILQDGVRSAWADVRLPHVISEHLVLQRDAPIRIWGWSDEEERVTVTLNRQTAVAVVDDGRWEVRLPAMAAGGPYELTVQGNNKLTVPNILIGEVWFCSGQSNMALGVIKSLNHEQEIRAADYPKIRFMTTPRREVKKPAHDVDVQWLVCSPRTVAYFSATAYYFGRAIHQELDIPVGLIVSAVNGTRIEPWTPANAAESVSQHAPLKSGPAGSLYNGMVHPFTPLAIRGVIWYQGEGNVGDGMEYFYRMQALVNGWRKSWEMEEMPFYYVQIAPLNWGGKPRDQHPQLWEAQTASLSIPHTGMAVTNDIGNPGDAHPKNKQEVGRRLALWAFAKTYGKQDVVYSGPIYAGMKIEGEKIRILFDHAHGGLVSRDGKPLNGFTIAEKDGRFLPAHAQIDGQTVVVYSDTVEEPTAVRFAWDQAAEPNLMNKAGLPASAFRTDPDR